MPTDPVVTRLTERARTEGRIAKLLGYFMSDIGWEFEDLTDEEQAAVEHQEGLDAMKAWADERLRD